MDDSSDSEEHSVWDANNAGKPDWGPECQSGHAEGYSVWDVNNASKPVRERECLSGCTTNQAFIEGGLLFQLSEARKEIHVTEEATESHPTSPSLSLTLNLISELQKTLTTNRTNEDLGALPDRVGASGCALGPAQSGGSSQGVPRLRLAPAAHGGVVRVRHGRGDVPPRGPGLPRRAAVAQQVSWQ
ncbi:hypothetical protein Pelo_19323 [Pelomyxa schiedti]|nr:hypothetical protein Pelo_19323 [Pelomyxa schiedti]